MPASRKKRPKTQTCRSIEQTKAFNNVHLSINRQPCFNKSSTAVSSFLALFFLLSVKIWFILIFEVNNIHSTNVCSKPFLSQFSVGYELQRRSLSLLLLINYTYVYFFWVILNIFSKLIIGMNPSDSLVIRIEWKFLEYFQSYEFHNLKLFRLTLK